MQTKKLRIWERVECLGGGWGGGSGVGVCGGGVFTQHPREASRLRLVLLNMERGHTAKAAGSF